MATILIVGGEDYSVGPLQHAFEEAGFDVDIAADATTGLVAAETGRPALVVLAAWAPDADSVEAVQEIQRAGDLPLILLIEGAGQADRARGLELGADDCLTKPVNPRELVARARAILRRRVGSGRRGSPPLDEGVNPAMRAGGGVR